MEKIEKACFFVSTSKSSFVVIDEKILRKNIPVIDFIFNPNNAIQILISMIKLIVSIVINIRKIDFFYIWFADYHSFLPIFFAKLFNRKSILILGGSDCLNIPQYKLGNIYGPLGLRKRCVVYSLKHANLLVPVDESLISNKNTYATGKLIESGIDSFVARSKNDIWVQPTSIDDKIWKVGSKNGLF